MLIPYVTLILLLVIITDIDIRTQKIPNWCVAGLTLMGLSWNFYYPDGLGLQESSKGLLMGLLLFLPGYIFATMGAGDVKLMAAIGTVTGLDLVMDIALASYLVMCFMAIGYMAFKGGLTKFLERYRILVLGLMTGQWCYQKADTSEASRQRLPIAPAVLIGSVYVLFPKFCTMDAMAALCHWLN